MEYASQRPLAECPEATLPKRLRPFLLTFDADGKPTGVHADRYEFWLYRQIRKRLKSGEIYLDDSFQHRCFTDELVSLDEKTGVLSQMDIPFLRQPIEAQLDALTAELRAQWLAFNRELRQGKLKHLDYDRETQTLTWRKPKADNNAEREAAFYAQLPFCDVADVFRFVNEQCQFLSALTPLQPRYAKPVADADSLMAVIVAQAMNHGNLVLSRTSDLPYHVLEATYQQYLRQASLQAANDRISNAIAGLPIFPHYSFDLEALYGAVDGQKFGVERPTVKARYSRKYFGRGKGVVAYTLLCNHVPLQGWLIGAHEYEAHHVFDIWYRNTSDIVPTTITGDMHSVNKANFAILHWFGLRFEPRFTDLEAQLKELYCADDPALYEKCLIRPVGQIDLQTVVDEEANIDQIVATLGLKEMTQGTLIRKLCTYTASNPTRRAIFEFDKLIRSLYTLRYLRDPKVQRNVHRSQNRIESYHQLRSAIAQVGGKKELTGRTDIEIEISNQCARLIANAIIFYNSAILSRLLEKYEANPNSKILALIKKISPAAWRHILLNGHYTFRGKVSVGITGNGELFAHPAKRGGIFGGLGLQPLFRNLLQYLENRRIIVPGYSFLQDMVSQALAAERTRLTGIIEKRLDPTTLTALDALYVVRDGTYAITPLKRDPKDFSLHEMKREIARSRSLEPLYRAAQALLPELGLSNDSIAYYAALVDYYTVQKLQQLPAGMARLYLLCFLLQRYQKINDNQVHALIYHVRKVDSTAKACMEQQVLAFQREGHANIERLGQILNLFLDPSIADSVSFGEIKQRAFGILDENQFQRATHYLSAQTFDTAAFEWDFIASLAPSFKQHLRPLLLRLPLKGHREDDSLMEAVAFLRKCFHQGKSLARYRFEQVPKAFIPQGVKSYLYEKDPEGSRRIHPDKYEFLVYRLLRHRLEAGDIYVADSLCFRSFDEDLIPKETWQRDNTRILQEIDAPWLSRPMADILQDLEQALEADYNEVNRRILLGGNPHVKLNQKRSGEITWTLPYVGEEETVNHSFFDDVPQLHIASLLQFVDSRCQCLDAFTHILLRYVKTPPDRHAIVACLIAYGTNVGLGKMGAISDLSYPTLFTAANNFLRPETVREGNDRVSNATAKLPIFRHYRIDDIIHSSSDGQKFETQIHTLRSRHSPKYFGLKKGITNYTGVANHVPFNARIIGANESESHYVYDILTNNTTDIRPNTHSTDTHGTNEVNFAILAAFDYQFAPRYRDIRDKMDTLYGFKHPSQYAKEFLLKPRRKINTALILAEEDNLKHILASLAKKVTRQSVIIGKLSSYARKNRTKKALWELDNVYRSCYLLTYVDSLRLRRNVQRALNRGESYHKLVRAVAYANGGRLRVRTDLEQQLWSECSRFLANCVIYYNACLLSELLVYAEREKDVELADRLKRISPVSWKHVNFYDEYTFQEIGEAIDLGLLVQRWLASRRDGANQAQ